MKETMKEQNSIGTFFRAYLNWLVPLLLVTLGATLIGLALPKLIAKHIDLFQATGTYNIQVIIIELLGVTISVLLLTLAQSFLSTYVSEKIALDLRQKLAKKISQQSFNYISTTTVPRVLTIVTSDVDGVKNLISQGIVAVFAAVLILVGSIVALLSIQVKLALITLIVIPIIIVAFVMIFGKIGILFHQTQENLEKINKVVNESIVGASLVRVLHSAESEITKFDEVNIKARNLGLAIVKGFSALVPIITFVANATVLLIVWFGGLDVIAGDLSLGNFSAFFAYSGMLMMPIFIIAFISNSLSRAMISWQRISSILLAPLDEHVGTHKGRLRGEIVFQNVSLSYGSKEVLKNISFTIKSGTKNAIVGPVSAGKTQILYLITGLVKPDQGAIKIDQVNLIDYERNHLLRSMGLVFQDSLIFNATVRENIQMHNDISDADLQKAIMTAQLADLIEALPRGLDTQISERGSNLSGGQKQRLMLARALANNPKVLLLDDFTARVDRNTEQEIIQAIEKNYPQVTLISITQKVDPVKNYDQIIVIMEGELIAAGKHGELINSSLEYRQICESQKTSE